MSSGNWIVTRMAPVVPPNFGNGGGRVVVVLARGFESTSLKLLRSSQRPPAPKAGGDCGTRNVVI